MNDESESVSQWISKLPQGDSQAQLKIWVRYSKDIEYFARRYLAGVERSSSDEEDIAIDVLHALYSGMEDGRITRVANRKHLWALLLSMTYKRSIQEFRRKTAQKRGGRNVIHATALDSSNGTQNGIENGTHAAQSRDVDPEMAAIHAEATAELMRILRNPNQRRALELRIEGHSMQEIAELFGCHTRTVERLFQEIRAEIQRHYFG